MLQAIAKPVLVIGYGNSLRGDDSVGRRVAEQIAASGLDRVEAVSITQLVPELASAIARARAVIFVDACIATKSAAVDIERLRNDRGDVVTTHHTGPREILALANACYLESPPAWLVSVPAAEFELAERVSAGARAGVDQAVDAILRLILELDEPPRMM